jgi:hypothetical protein
VLRLVLSGLAVLLTGRRGRAEWDRSAPTVQAYAGFRVGQGVIVSRNHKTAHYSFAGTIISLVVPMAGWKFAVVQDGNGGTHACDFDEMS